MPTPQSSRYLFKELIADHGPFQSWRAVNLTSGEPCFLKVTYAASAMVGDALIQSQLAGIKLQRRIQSARVVKARAHYVDGGVLYVEYPLLDGTWTRLTSDLFAEAPEQILVEICLTVDYLHQLGLVHGDIKLENFLIQRAPLLKVRLIDLDFLAKEDSRPQARLFGTPGYIAPEIRDNKLITIQSDNFSLGVSLSNAVGWMQAQTDLTAEPEWRVRLQKLVERLTHPEYLQRPSNLLAACRRFELIDDCQYQVSVRTLVAAYLLSRARWPRFLNSRSPKALDFILRAKLGLFGVHPDLTSALYMLAQHDLRRAWSAAKTFLGELSIDQYEKFFYLNISDQQAWALLQQCQPTDWQVPANPQEALSLAETVAREGKPLVAYLLLNNQVNRSAYVSHDEARAVVHQYLGQLATQLNRLPEAHAHYAQALDLRRRRNTLNLSLMHEAAMATMRANCIDQTAALLDEAETCQNGTAEDRLNLQRIKGWLLLVRGNYRDASDLLRSVVDQADQAELIELSILARYSMGISAWRQADRHQAEALLREAVELGRAHNRMTDALLPLSTLAFVYGEIGLFHKAVKAARLAIRVAAPEHKAKLVLAYDCLLYAYPRMAQFDKARYSLQEFLSVRHLETGPMLFFTYSLNLGIVDMLAGRLREAAATLSPAYTRATEASGQINAGKICQALANIALWQGRLEACKEYISSGRAAFNLRNDKSALTELDLIEAQVREVDTSSADPEQFLSLARALEHVNSSHYACQSLMMAFLKSPKIAAKDTSLTLRELVARRDSRSVPLFASINKLTECYDHANVASQDETACWKAVFTELLRGRHMYLAMHVALKLSQLYSHASHPRHAHKHLRHARSLANSVENERFGASVDRLLATTGGPNTDQSRLLESYISISEMLRDIGDYQQALRRVVEFAVEQTGAERGILFLKRGEHDTFQIGASVNCDERSLEELSDFSTHLPWLSSQDQTPLLIDNAVLDQRTNKYHSVIEHNILSVACVPLWAGPTLRGVLYLDHHIIPSLFEPNDIRYLVSLANFLTLILTTASTWRTMTVTNAQLRDDLSRLGSPGSLVTEAPEMLNMLAKLPQIARTSTSVLIQGESGTGKEILADMIHRYSLRPSEPLIKLNCATLSPTLLESELFGHVKGAFTGAIKDKKGKFELADGGTLLLDEIGDMPLDIQAKVLRAIEYQQFEKVGSNRSTHTDIRFLYATNRNLGQLVEQGKFRQDLYYRINIIVLEIPPLRQRPIDIPVLIDHFLALLCLDSSPPRFSSTALDALMRYQWPGNVRQLRNLVDRCIILHPGSLIEPDMLPPEISLGHDHPQPTDQAIEELEKARLRSALAKTSHNLTQTARLLNMSLTTLRRRIKKYGL